MESIKTWGSKAAAVCLLAMALALAAVAASPAQAHAEGTLNLTTDALSAQADATDAVSIKEIWVDEYSGSYLRQPATGGRFAWLAWVDPEDYYEDWSFYLYESVSASDFMLQVKVPGGEWTDVPGRNLVVVGDNQVWAPYEATIAALVPDNTEPVTKNWRIVYQPLGIESETISQAPCLPTSDAIEVSDADWCIYYDAAQLPWSREQYEKDHIPPIYLSYIEPGILLQLKDLGLTAEGSDACVLNPPFSWGSSPLSASGVQYTMENLYDMAINITPHTDEEAGGSAGTDDDEETSQAGSVEDLVGYWEDMQMYGIMDIDAVPTVDDLYNALVPYALNPDNPAVSQAVVLWVNGATAQPAAADGVTDCLWVIIPDFQAHYTERHVWGAPEWSWAGSDEEGYTAANAIFTCEVKSYHKQVALGKLVREYKDGANVYTATAVFEGFEYTDTKTVVGGIDKNDLKAAIDAAATDRDKTVYSDDGMDLPDGTQYATQDAREMLIEAIAAAQKVLASDEDTQPEIDDATATLNADKEAFDNAKITVAVDKTALTAGIEAARAAQDGVKVSADGKDVVLADKWIAAAGKKALDDAIAAAQAVADKADATQTEVNMAVEAVKGAQLVYEKTLKAGTKQAAVDPGKDDPGKDDRANQKGKDGTAVGEGASAEAAEKAIMSASSDEGPAGSKFGKVQLRSTKQAKKAVTLKWTKVKNAKKYVVYAGKCGQKGMKKVGELAKTTLTFKKAMGKAFKAGKYYKAIVVALDADNNVISTSKAIHVKTKGGKTVNPGKVTTKAKKNKVTVKKGKSFALKGKAAPAAKGKKISSHRAVKYETSNAKIATVSKKGVIKGKKAGTCTVYAYAQNGVFAKVKVTVK